MFRALLVVSALVAAASSANIVTTEPFWGQKYVDINSPRALLVDEAGDLLVVQRTSLSVTAIYEEQTEAGTQVLKATIIDGRNDLRLNHGIAYLDGFLYLSSETDVYRFPYTPGQRTQSRAEPERVVTNIPPGGHETRTLVFDGQRRLYISVGSGGNVDSNSDRARIRRFNIENLPINFNTGEVFADGLRNEVGLAFDSQGVLWGVENGADNLNRPDIGGDVHNDNPAEDLNKFDGPLGQHYGYPYCFSSYDLPGYEKGTQFAWPTFMNDGTHTDAWCRNVANNRPPALAMPAHNAPLGVTFYKGQGCGVKEGAFPCSAVGDAVVAFHGSWNANPAKGYRVGWLPYNKNTNNPTGENVDVIFEQDPTNCNGACLRPVNAVFNNNGHLLVSCDSTNAIYRVTYDTPPSKIIN